MNAIARTTEPTSPPDALRGSPCHHDADDRMRATEAAMKRAHQVLARCRLKECRANEQTRRYYERRACPILSKLPADPAQVRATVEAALAHYAHSSNSYYMMTSALGWTIIRQLADLLRGLRAWQLVASDTPPTGAVTKVLQLCEVAEMLHTVTRANLMLKYDIRGVRARSKRHDLRYLVNDWQRLFIEESAKPPKFEWPIALLALTGLRPWELERGAELQRQGTHVVVKVQGAKVTADTGQPHREMMLRPDALPTGLLAAIDANGPVVVKVNADALRRYLYQLSVRLQSQLMRKSARRRPTRVIVSAYTFRHALADQLRDSGWDSDDIAQALGHCAAETQRQYGRRRRRRGGFTPSSSLSMVSASAPREIRHRPVHHFARLLEHLPKETRLRR